jgi:DNA polymerase III epsilon subunit-like protein
VANGTLGWLENVMRVLAFDCETQGFDFSKHRITEVGAIIFDSTTLKELGRFNTLVWDESYAPQSEEIVQITGITDAMLKADGLPFSSALRVIDTLIGEHGGVDYFMAHNAPFDKRAFLSELNRLDELPEAVSTKYAGLPWICTLNDIEHPSKFKSKKLAHLALDYGVTVNPKLLHRADADCELMIEMLREGKIDLENVIARSKLADVVIRALVPSPFGAKGDGGTGKDKAKACGFSYGKAGDVTVAQAWLKKVKENEIEKEQEALGYKVTIIG